MKKTYVSPTIERNVIGLMNKHGHGATSPVCDRIDGVRTADLLKEHGSPLFVYSETALREKYKNDKARLSQESMALYKAHKVNPLGGCLPMVVQIPVFFGLYKALLYAIELRHSPLFWWIQDLSAKDPYYITPLVMGATMFVQQKMTPTGADPMQAKIMLFMPIIFTFMFLNFPSGLVIYWLFNNIISIGQQVYINKKPS